jgi:hypothetical protein
LPGNPFEHPPWRAVGLGTAKPDDVVEEAAYRGRLRRYAQLRYGGPGSTRVTVVVDEAGPGDVDLYVDADRNRKIDARDRVQGHGHVWRVPLKIINIDEDGTRETPGEVALRIGSTGRILSAAVAGYREGRLTLGGREHAARRTDDDVDGSYTSPQDSLWTSSIFFLVSSHPSIVPPRVGEPDKGPLVQEVESRGVFPSAGALDGRRLFRP